MFSIVMLVPLHAFHIIRICVVFCLSNTSPDRHLKPRPVGMAAFARLVSNYRRQEGRKEAGYPVAGVPDRRSPAAYSMLGTTQMRKVDNKIDMKFFGVASFLSSPRCSSGRGGQGETIHPSLLQPRLVFALGCPPRLPAMNNSPCCNMLIAR